MFKCMSNLYEHDQRGLVLPSTATTANCSRVTSLGSSGRSPGDDEADSKRNGGEIPNYIPGNYSWKLRKPS